jgi:aminobenzoyl-glutamate utilization protein B
MCKGDSMATIPGSDETTQALQSAQPAIERICAEVWQLAETSLQEVQSSKIHQRELQAAGFTIVREGTAWGADGVCCRVEPGRGRPQGRLSG